MSFFSNNLRFLRTQRGLNLDEFEFLGIKKGTMSNYELGKTEPKFDILLELSKFFGISIDDFLTKPIEKTNLYTGKVDGKVAPKNTSQSGKTESTTSDGSSNGYFDGYPTPFFLSDSGKTKSTNIVSLPIPVEHDEELVSVPLVDISVAAGVGIDNPCYLEEIDCLRFPQSMIKRNHTYLCVRIKGESMVPTLQDGGYLVVRLLDRSEWEFIRDGHVYVVSDRDGKAYVKRIKNRLKQHGFIVCNSDNPDPMGYPSFNLQEDELHTVWYAEWYISAKMPNIHATYYNKVSELECAFDDMRRELRKELQEGLRQLKAELKTDLPH